MEMLLALIVLALVVTVIEGHGRLLEPASRSTMWRMGFDNPPNYNDNQLFCGGFSVQWNQNGGECGICGDNIKDNPRQNEAPDGKYANGIIVKKYDVGETMEIKVHLTANHKGWFEYRLCQNDDPKKAVQQDCFDRHLLADKDGRTRFVITSEMKAVSHRVKLPAGVRCEDCVLQWKYNTGNSWGVDPVTNVGCIGCGPQEQFYACADIAVGHDEVKVGESDKTVEVPNGDVDERKNLNETVDYNPDGTCMPCNCGQTNSNHACSVNPNFGFLFLALLIILTYLKF